MTSRLVFAVSICAGLFVGSSMPTQAQLFRRHPAELCWFETQRYPEYIVTNTFDNTSLAVGVGWEDIRLLTEGEGQRLFCPVLSDDLVDHSWANVVTVDLAHAEDRSELFVYTCVDEHNGLTTECLDPAIDVVFLSSGGHSVSNQPSPAWGTSGHEDWYPYLVIEMPPKAQLTGYAIEGG